MELHLLVHHFRDDTGGAVLDEPLGEVSSRATASKVAAVRSNLAHYYKCYFKKNFKPEDFAVRPSGARSILRDIKTSGLKLQHPATAWKDSFQNVDTGALLSAALYPSEPWAVRAASFQQKHRNSASPDQVT